MESRLTELEIKMGFAEDLLETLNRTVFRQQQEIEALQRALEALHRRVEELAAPREPRSLREEIPPHY